MNRFFSHSGRGPGAGLALILAATLGAVACGPGQEPAPASPPAPEGTVRLTPAQLEAADVQITPVTLVPVAETVEVPGTIVSPDTATSRVGSIVEGRVESVRVLPGDVVTRGQELMRIHSHELTDALRDLRAAEANLAYSDAAVGRTRDLLEAGAISREESQRRQAENEAFRAELVRSQELVGHLSPSDDGAVVIRAPRAGTVFEVSAKPGSAVVAGSPLVEVGRTDVLWATGWVPEEEAVRLAAGDSVRVRVQAIPGSDIHGRVVRMGGVVDPLRRAVEIRAELANLPQGIRPGLFATVLVPSGPALPRAVLPAEAVQHTTAGDMVFLEEGSGLFRPTSVEVVVLPDGSLAVTGLGEGDRVVTVGAYAVRSAMEGGALAEEG